jgi:hypothetical protein
LQTGSNSSASEYAERFAENRIDFSVLRDLTDQDLKDLGVEMLRAIGELDAASLTAPATSTEPVSQGTAERRQVTVMFSDLVGSTALSGMRRRDSSPLWWFRREVHGRWRPCVLWVIRPGA